MRAILAACSALAALPAGAQAPRSVHLVEPSCEELPFVRARLRELLDLELSVDGARLVDDPSLADARIAYEPEPCAAGATAFVLRLTDEAGELRLHRADMAPIPLATVPRALALELAEALRGNLPATAASSQPSAPPPEGPTAPPAELPIEPAPGAGPPVQAGASVLLRNTPDTGAVLGGARLFADLPLGRDLPLALRLDASLAFGRSAHDLVLGLVEGGLTIAVWVRAGALALRFGPRLWVGHGWAFDAQARGASRTSEPVQLGVALGVAADIALGAAVELRLVIEVGTHLLGLEYVVPAGRAGLIGAYWGPELALSWSL